MELDFVDYVNLWYRARMGTNMDMERKVSRKFNTEEREKKTMYLIDAFSLSRNIGSTHCMDTIGMTKLSL